MADHTEPSLSKPILGGKLIISKNGEEYIEIRKGYFWCDNLKRWFKVG